MSALPLSRPFHLRIRFHRARAHAPQSRQSGISIVARRNHQPQRHHPGSPATAKTMHQNPALAAQNRKRVIAHDRPVQIDGHTVINRWQMQPCDPFIGKVRAQSARPFARQLGLRCHGQNQIRAPIHQALPIGRVMARPPRHGRDRQCAASNGQTMDDKFKHRCLH